MINKNIHRTDFCRRSVRKILQDKLWHEVISEKVELEKTLKGQIDKIMTNMVWTCLPN
jgi:hypothetical protein